jgi:hypothetical protein
MYTLSFNYSNPYHQQDVIDGYNDSVYLPVNIHPTLFIYLKDVLNI